MICDVTKGSGMSPGQWWHLWDDLWTDGRDSIAAGSWNPVFDEWLQAECEICSSLLILMQGNEISNVDPTDSTDENRDDQSLA